MRDEAKELQGQLNAEKTLLRHGASPEKVIHKHALRTGHNNFYRAAEQAAEDQKKLNEQIKNSSEVGLKAEQNYLKNQEKLEIAKAKLKGATEEEIFKIQQDYRAQNIRALERNYNETKGIDAVADKEKLDAIKSAIIEGQVAESEHQIKLKEIFKLELNKTIEKNFLEKESKKIKSSAFSGEYHSDKRKAVTSVVRK